MPAVSLSSVVSSALGVWMSASTQIAGAAVTPVNTCESITLARPGVSVAYKGTVRNDDYRVKIVIPAGPRAGCGAGNRFMPAPCRRPNGASLSCFAATADFRANRRPTNQKIWAEKLRKHIAEP